MAYKDTARKSAMRAAEVVRATQALQRVEQDGYTRIDPFHIAAAEGVVVMLRPLQKLYGAFVRQSTPGILINGDRSAGLIHMTCAHELGHFFMGHSSVTDERIDYGSKGSLVEQEADLFGYHLLAPKVLLVNLIRRKRWMPSTLSDPFKIYQLALRLGISFEATIRSLRRFDLINDIVGAQLLNIAPAKIKKAILGEALPDATKEVWLLDENDKDSILEPRPEDHLIVRLKSHAGSGYLWHTNVDELGSEGFHLAPLTAESTDVDDGLEILHFGGPPEMDYLVTGGRVLNDEPHRLQLCETRPWLPEDAPNETYSSRTKFEEVQFGLTQEARRRLLRESIGS